MSLDTGTTIREGLDRLSDPDVIFAGAILFVLGLLNAIFSNNLLRVLSEDIAAAELPEMTLSVSIPFLNTPVLASLPVLIVLVAHAAAILVLIRTLDGRSKEFREYVDDLLVPTAHVIIGGALLIAGTVALLVPILLIVLVMGNLLGFGQRVAVVLSRLALLGGLAYIAASLIFYIPEIALNDRGFITAFKESYSKTADNRIRIIALVVVTSLIPVALGRVGEMVVSQTPIPAIASTVIVGLLGAAGLMAQWSILVEAFDRLQG